jgi:hypothetical protein
MRDRFPMIVITGLLATVGLAAYLSKGAARGGFADALSSYRSEPSGTRGMFLLAEESGVPVDRLRTDLTILEAKDAVALFGVQFSPRESKHHTHHPLFVHRDAGEDEEDDPESLEKMLNGSRQVDDEERDKLLEHVKGGATLIYVPRGSDKDALLEDLHVDLWPSLDRAPGIRTVVPAQPSPYTAGVQRLETKVQTFLGLPDDGVPLLVDQYTLNIVAGWVPYGQGSVLVIGAPELAMNAALGRADNAQFWLSTLRAAAGKGQVLVDEFHHGFSDDRSIAEFARRYGLHFAAAQLLLGLCLWAASLRRFGKPKKPAEDQRVGAIDALFAQSRLYREGKHQAFAAQLISSGLSQELAPTAGLPSRSEGNKEVAGLHARGRPELGRALADVVVHANGVSSETDLQRVAELAARARQRARIRILSPSKRSRSS